MITGELDFITGPVCAADFATIPDQRTVLVEDCGHFILYEKRDRFRDEVVELPVELGGRAEHAGGLVAVVDR